VFPDFPVPDFPSKSIWVVSFDHLSRGFLHRLLPVIPRECDPRRSPLRAGYRLLPGGSISDSETPEVAMNLDLEKDFENQRWRLLALVEGRKSLSEGSESALKTDSEIISTRNLIRSYEVLKGYWSTAETSPAVVAPRKMKRSGSLGGFERGLEWTAPLY
jgi:hypothetical protein